MNSKRFETCLLALPRQSLSGSRWPAACPVCVGLLERFKIAPDDLTAFIQAAQSRIAVKLEKGTPSAGNDPYSNSEQAKDEPKAGVKLLSCVQCDLFCGQSCII
jgi:hypothetical protein